MAGSPHVAIVGAGIIGSSIAVNLSRKGCKVTVLDAGQNIADGATAKSWAWLNANRKTPVHYKDLNKAGMEEWRKLTERAERPEGEEIIAEFPGTICLGDTRDEDPQYPSQPLTSAQISSLESELSPHFLRKGGRLYQQEGYGYPSLLAAQYLEEAQALGAEIRLRSQVTSISHTEGSATALRTADSGSCEADIIVLAAGLGVPQLAESLGSRVSLLDKPGTLTVLTQPMPQILQHILVTDEAFIMQRRDGEIMISFFKAAVNHSPGAGPGEEPPRRSDASGEEIQEHIRESVHQQEEGHQHEASVHLNASDEIAQREIRRAAEICPILRDASLGSFSLAKYPYPPDAHPILGWLPGQKNVYVAVTHSGATLGPLLGRLAAEEVLGRPQDLLQHYRPDRDFSDQSHLY